MQWLVLGGHLSIGSFPLSRRVGRALRTLPVGTRIPWHRVVNARGRVSLPEGSAGHCIQRERLEGEGVAFRANGAIDLRRLGWRPGVDDRQR